MKCLSVLLAVTLGPLVAGCYGTLCPSLDDYPEIQRATFYDYRSPPGGRSGHLQPFNTWVERPSLAAFLQRGIDQGGRTRLVSEYGFQCTSPSEAACRDCLTCTRSVRTEQIYLMWTGAPDCENTGEILVRAHIGPGSSVKAITYWRTWLKWSPPEPNLWRDTPRER